MPITSVARVKTTVELTPTGIQCNACGKLRTVAEHGEHDFSFDMHHVELSGGYGDDYPGDLSTLSFQVCGDCLKKWTDTFAIPPQITSDVFCIHPTFSAIHSETGETWTIDGLWAYPEGTEFTEPVDVNSPGGEYPVEGVWEHFKGQKYEVHKSVLTNPVEPEILVVYRALYGDSKTFVRPAKMWGEMVTHEGRQVQRFRRVE